MSQYLYSLEPYNGPRSRYICPLCNKKEKTFVRYINTETGEHLAPNVGRCNREVNCGYHYTPKQYFTDNRTYVSTRLPRGRKLEDNRIRMMDTLPQRTPEEINQSMMGHTMMSYDNNNFVKFLNGIFPKEISDRLIKRYMLATSKHWKGACIFWQIDYRGWMRSGKIILYDSATGKRVKDPYPHITWVHTVLKVKNFTLRQCLFGEHLLSLDPLKPVALVESEKTAIIASVYMPEFIWLATGGLNNLNPTVCNVLKGRKVTLFPDVKGYDKWAAKAKDLSAIANFKISRMLETMATQKERQQGCDLADYLLRFDYRGFLQ